MKLICEKHSPQSCSNSQEKNIVNCTKQRKKNREGRCHRPTGIPFWRLKIEMKRKSRGLFFNKI